MLMGPSSRSSIVRLFFRIYLISGHVFLSHVNSTVTFDAFRDDFNSLKLNTSAWNPTNKKSVVNREEQFYLPKCVFVKDGSLTLQARDETYADANYTSGRIDTRGFYSFLYGQVEWQAQIPKGRGIWSAMWLLEQNCAAAVECSTWPPAVMIEFNGIKPTIIVATVCKKSLNKNVCDSHQYDTQVDLSLQYHLYRIEWLENRLRWFFDDKEVHRTDGDDVPKVPMQVVMNVAVGGNFVGLPDNQTVFPAALLVNYVYVRPKKPVLVQDNAGSILGPVLGGIAAAIFLGISVVVFLGLRRKRIRQTKGTMSSKRLNSYMRDSVRSSPDDSSAKNEPFGLMLDNFMTFLEVPEANVEISEEVLGKGEYGVVRKGTVRSVRGYLDITTVAVKSLIAESNENHKRQFIEEMKLMSKLGRHQNIVNLVGATFKGKILLLLEYCPFGNLRDYLQVHQSQNSSYVGDDKVSSHSSMPDSDELELQTTTEVVKPELDTQDLIYFAYQISCGMHFLSCQSIIHRDLAARNVLVCENKLLKIADFGLARQHFSPDYIQSTHVGSPVKWMAPEAIKSKTFSQASDVWSYGVVLWEIFSFGNKPYAEVHVFPVNEFYKSINRGLRLSQPARSPKEIYSLMENCWALNPLDRPNFDELKANTGKQHGLNGNGYLHLEEACDYCYEENEEFVQS